MKLKQEILEQIKECIGAENVLEEEPMNLHTSMEVGGPAAYLFQPETTEATAFLLKVLQQENYPFYVKGNGSNLIVHDEGYDGAIIEMMKMNQITVEGDHLTAECGAMLKDISAKAVEASLSGFEFASGIPGSLGGAITMNAGAYDGEMKDIVKEVTLMDKTGNILVKKNEEMDFSYRHSMCSDGDYLVLQAKFKLEKGDPQKIQEKIDDLSARRKEKQPLEYPSCGSTFKRPEGYFAGKLITDAGLKGYCHGGAAVSDKHAGFIINKDHATATEVLELISYVQEEVKEQFGVELKCEVKII